MIHGKLKIRILKLMTPTHFLAFKQLYHFLNWCCRSVGDSGFCFGRPYDILVVLMLMILVGKASRTSLLQTPEQNLGGMGCVYRRASEAPAAGLCARAGRRRAVPARRREGSCARGAASLVFGFTYSTS